MVRRIKISGKDIRNPVEGEYHITIVANKWYHFSATCLARVENMLFFKADAFRSLAEYNQQTDILKQKTVQTDIFHNIICQFDISFLFLDGNGKSGENVYRSFSA